MKVRSVTCFLNVGDASKEVARILAAGQLAGEARDALQAAGYDVQTIRLATQPFTFLPGDPLPQALELWAGCAEAGFDYLSVGPVLADEPQADLSRLEVIPDLIRGIDALFAGILVASARAKIYGRQLWYGIAHL